MTFDVVELDATEADKVRLTEESHTADVKSIVIAPAKLTRTMAAFCNAEGGDLFIGISETTRTGERAWEGFPSIEDANGIVQTFEEFFPAGQFSDYQFLRMADNPGAGLVLKATLTKTPDVKKSSDPYPRVRR